VNVEPLTVEGRSIEKVIEWVADRRAVDLVVLGQRKRSQLEKWFTCSVESRLIRSALCPLLILRSDGYEEVRPEALITRLYRRDEMRFS
jgi:nucleotide-binding universal stress UspA family protein